MSTATLDQTEQSTMNAQSVNVSSLFTEQTSNVTRRVTGIFRNTLGQLQGWIRFQNSEYAVVRPRHSKHWRVM